MGIVRDVTVDQLTQAVGNIDTSTLAQDSTLQAVVTAISNISGGNDPVTNTTVNTLGKDTSLQSIAAAITGLGTALGSDRALIDGSNIGNQALFRENIGLGYSVSTQNYDGLTWTIIKLGNLYFLSTEITIPANTTPATWGSLYVYRNSNKQWWTLPVVLIKKIADLSFTDGSTAGIPIAYTDISSQPNSATTADIARPTTTSSAITVRKFICGYVA